MAKKTGKAVKAAAKRPVSKKTPAKPKAKAQTNPRRLQQLKYRGLQRLKNRAKHPVKLPNVWQLTRTASLTLWEHRNLFAGIVAVYGLLNVILAQGLSGSSDVSSLRSTLDKASKGHFGHLGSGLSVFGTLLGSSANNSDTSAGAYQLFLVLIASLAVIWGLRQVLAGKPVRVRDTYYRGMYPLIPFVLVLLVITMQLIPLLVGSTIYALVINNSIAVLFIEKLAWGLLYALLAFWSFYMVSSSIFALYIVTLPDMTPLKALRSAKELVHHRRWIVLRKALYLPFILLLTGAVIMLPIIIWLTPVSKWVFFLLTMLSLAAAHAYMYTLYRELLDE